MSVRNLCSIVIASAIFALAVLPAASQATITLGQVDDFQSDGAEWGPLFAASVAPDEGPGGGGDQALFVEGGLVRHGSEDINVDPSNTDQWNGNWTGEKVTHIRMDVRNPNSFELNMRLGIAGTGGPNPGYSGDTYLTPTPIIVPADDQWHSITFDVTASSWANSGSGSDPGAALQDVTHFRILHNTIFDYHGGGGNFYLDNITAIPEPSSLLLGSLSIVGLLAGRRRNG